MAGNAYNVEALLAELQQKDDDLILAGGLGVKLVEENESLKQQLKQEITRLEEFLESQKHSSVKVLHETKKAAELYISKLMIELDTCKFSLEQTKSSASSAHEEYSRSLRRLQEENAQLKEYLTEVEKRYEFRLDEMKRKLEDSDETKWEVKVERIQSQKLLEEVQGEHKSMERNLSSMYRSCEKLSMELEGSREEIDYWEEQYHSREELLHYQNKELDDSRDMLDILQRKLQMKQSPMEHHDSTVSSCMSLFDELSSAQDLVQDAHEIILPDPTPAVHRHESETTDEDKTLTLKYACKEKDTERVDNAIPVCQRCLELKDQNEKQQEEIKRTTEQLLLAVKHKIKLQLQIEAWESDMAYVIDDQVNRKIKSELFSNSTLKAAKQGHSCSECDIASLILKYSWIF